GGARRLFQCARADNACATMPLMAGARGRGVAGGGAPGAGAAGLPGGGGGVPPGEPPGGVFGGGAPPVGGRARRLRGRGGDAGAEGRPEHTAAYPRVSVMGVRRGQGGGRPVVHLNGHFDVVPAGGGWTVDPFAGLIRDGRVYGRGTGDMKAGLAAAVYAAEAVRRAGLRLPGTVEGSGTVDEESGGVAGGARPAPDRATAAR